MKPPDVIVTWPNGYDYPPFRAQMQRFAGMFNRIFVCIYPKREPDLRDFYRAHWPCATLVECHNAGAAWRETAVRAGLVHSRADWVLFTEQDMFWTESMLQKLLAMDQGMFGIKQGIRMHPCFILVRRDVIDSFTSKDFSIGPTDWDHFAKFTQELWARAAFTDLKDLGLVQATDWYHLNSATWNLDRLLGNTHLEEFHNAEDFIAYNEWSIRTDVPKLDYWRDFELTARERLKAVPIKEKGSLPYFLAVNKL